MKAKQLSNEEKLKIYTLAKELYLKEVEFNTHKLFSMRGMCYHIKNALIKLGYGDFSKTIYEERKVYQPKCFSEFFKLKPKITHDMYYWWDVENTQIRIEKFDFLIKLVTETK